MFRGTYTALVTPFSGDTVDYESFGKMIDFQIEQGVHGLVPCGTTGESATLTEEEHRAVIEFTIKKAAGRVKVIAGTGSNCTATAVELTAHAKKAGADGALIITPYYNKPTQDGLYTHFKTIADAIDIPIILYNVPGRTGVNMLPETVARLYDDCPNIVGLKDATGNMTQSSRTMNAVNDDGFLLFSGEDAIVFPMLSIGGAGVISVFSNVDPASMSALTNAFFAGDFDRAREIHYRQLPLADALFLETNPIPVKTALKMLGRGNGQLRSPMCGMQEGTRSKLEQVLKTYGLL